MTRRVNLALGLAPYNPWGFRKRLVDTDLRYGCSLYLPKEDFELAILSEMDLPRVHKLGQDKGIQVKVLVIEQGIEYTVSLAKLPGGKYVMRGGWYDIVLSKGFKPLDVIGLLWNNASERFFLHQLK